MKYTECQISHFASNGFSNVTTGFFGAVSSHNWRASGIGLIKVL
jgi:hypothetical protein